MVFALAVYFLLNIFLEMPAFVLVFILISTVFVDIDARNSKFGNRWFLRPLQWVTNHRGFFHGLAAALIISLIVGFVNLWAGFGFFVGYVAHLFLDCLTLGGVKLFWPFDFKVSGFVRSGGTLEDIIFVLLLLGNIFIVGKIFLETLF
jgi:membrane-bound metal-dependent hydrolase YbcI (DUF457 family)